MKDTIVPVIKLMLLVLLMIQETYVCKAQTYLDKRVPVNIICNLLKNTYVLWKL